MVDKFELFDLWHKEEENKKTTLRADEQANRLCQNTVFLGT